MIREERVNIDDGGQNLLLVIHDFPALDGAVWLSKFILMLSKADIKLPDGADFNATLDYLTAPENLMNLVSSMDWETIKPLLFDLFKCVERLPSMNGPRQPMSDETSINAIVNSPLTIFKIWGHVLRVNFSFFSSTLQDAPAGNQSSSTTARETLPADITMPRRPR